ncbi:MAG: fumarylacetoacetate hydrolase family protein [Woeseiaceae bacterium]
MNLFDLEHTTIPVANAEDEFPVRRIYCIGRNYAAHSREMGHNPDREPPFYFMKPADAVVVGTATIDYPPRTADLHHEIELVVAIGKDGSDIAVDAALEHVFGYAVGIDLTRRDLQKEAKKLGRPWDTAKGFDQSAPISAIHKATDIGHPSSGRIWLAVNDEIRQQGDLNELIWGIAEAIAELSTLFEIKQGDILFTGTPSGVGAVIAGDRLTGGIEGIDEIQITIK